MPPSTVTIGHITVDEQAVTHDTGAGTVSLELADIQEARVERPDTAVLLVLGLLLLPLGLGGTINGLQQLGELRAFWGPDAPTPPLLVLGLLSGVAGFILLIAWGATRRTVAVIKTPRHELRYDGPHSEVRRLINEVHRRRRAHAGDG